MDPKKDKTIDSLLEWHLNVLDEDVRAWVESELERDAELRGQSDRLGRVLRPLDHWTVATEPAHLTEKVLEAVSAATPRSAQESAEPRVYRFPFSRLRNVGAVAACIVLLIGAFVPGLSAMRSRSQRVLCANNLGGVFEGLSAYQASFAGALPFAGFMQNAAWLPGQDGQSTCASNSRHVFLLLKHRFVPRSEVFVCPSAKDAAPMGVAALDRYNDFAERRNVSYDSLNLAGGRPNVRPTAPIAYLADANPLFVNARFNDAIDPQNANSPAHGGCGQAVLILDGRAEYLRTPIYGAHKDNVWVIEGVRRYTGSETPTRADDAFLVPGFPCGDRSRDVPPTH